MIHKFISNDNKGNVNTVEIGSTYTKLGMVAAPVEDTDAANKAYVDSVAGGSSGGGVLVVNIDMQTRTLDKTYKEIADAGFAVLHFPDSEFEANYYTLVLDHFGPYVDDGGTTMYTVEFWDHAMNSMYFETNSENGYPVFAE